MVWESRSRSEIAVAGIETKIRRAGDHAQELDVLTKDWLENGPQAVLHIDADGDWEVGSVEVPLVPPELPVILGDVVHNLRSALDHLVYELVIALNLKPGGHNYFPLAYDKDEFRRLITARKDTKGRLRKGALDPIPADHEVVKLIRGHQPYNRRDSYYKTGTPADLPFSPEMEWLAVIQRMWNTDKHRMLLRATYTCPDTEQEILDLFGWDPGATILEQKVNRSLLNSSLEHRHELARFRFAKGTGPRPCLHAKAAFPGEIMLGNQLDNRINVRFGHSVPAYHFVGRVDSIFKDLKGFL
jgi:hypothetical protein